MRILMVLYEGPVVDRRGLASSAKRSAFGNLLTYGVGVITYYSRDRENHGHGRKVDWWLITTVVYSRVFTRLGNG